MKYNINIASKILDDSNGVSIEEQIQLINSFVILFDAEEKTLHQISESINNKVKTTNNFWSLSVSAFKELVIQDDKPEILNEISNKKLEIDTTEIKRNLIEKLNFSTDTELFKLLDINNDHDQSLIFAWIDYQNAFSFNDGLSLGKSYNENKLTNLKFKLRKLAKNI